MIDAVDYWVIPYTEPNDHGSTRYSVFVQIRDHSGAVGWGEAVTIFDEAARSTMAILDGWASMIIGLEPDPAVVREAVYAQAWWYAGGGSAAFALAAIDVAVWDLRARLQGCSVVDLLGGPGQPENPTLPIIVSTHAFYEDLGHQSAFLASCVSDLGAAGVKVGWGKKGGAGLGVDKHRDALFAQKLRQSLPPQSMMMFDIGARIRWSVEEAIDRVATFEPYGLYWIEEPLGADDPDGYRRLKESTSVLIAYGEREWTANGIRRILSTGTVDVVGIDAGRVEGITGFADAVHSIQAAGKQVNAHAFAGPSSYAAGLAVSLTTPACRQFEVAPLRNELMTRLAPALEVPHGSVTTLPGHGLGVEIDRDAVVSLAVSGARAS
ncbi:MAG: mandelate racemase/muconate lactonizing enzyme family protein [Microbacteriaceae bacterium]|nr:mandelate racemase/muconate lactonizing enzyme family protein [Microbacteriaceae bacterium]